MDNMTVTNESNKEVCINVEEVHLNVEEFNKEEVHPSEKKFTEPTELQGFVSSVKEQLDALPDHFHLGFIYKVSQKYRKSKEDFYTPRLVAIGPLHHRKSHLQAMETYKLRCLKYLQNKYGNGLLDELSKYAIIKERPVRSCYEDFKFEANEFSEMILLDGIFIIHLFLKKDMHMEDDMLEWNSWMASDVMHDMLLLENQLPLFFIVGLLEILHPYINYFHDTFEEFPDSFHEIYEHSHLEYFQDSTDCVEESFQDSTDCVEECFQNSTDCVEGSSKSPIPNFEEYFLKHSLDYFKEVGITGRLKLTPDRGDVWHLVDFLVTLHRPSKEPAPSKEEEDSFGRFEYTRSASELREAGVRFSPLTEELFAVSFDESTGMLKIPQLTINDTTETFFRNLIAFEQCVYKEKPITSYIIFMDSLINTADDVKLLVNRDILKNLLVENQLVADMFNNLYKEVIEDERNFYFADICNKLNAYTKDYFHRWKSRWFKWKLILENKYFNNPWSVISFTAAGIIIVLTIVQTVCSILGA